VTTLSVSRWESLDQGRAEKKAEIRAAFEASIQSALKTYPLVERDSWPKQRQEAEAFDQWRNDGRSGNAPATPLLDGIAAERGISTEDMVDRVLTKVAEFDNIAAQALGKKQRLEDQIEAATTQRAVAEVQW